MTIVVASGTSLAPVQLGIVSYSVDCHVSIILQPFLPGLVLFVCLSSAHLIPSQGRSFPVNKFSTMCCVGMSLLFLFFSPIMLSSNSQELYLLC